jgi:cell division protein FtsA
MNSIENNTQSAYKVQGVAPEKAPVYNAPVDEVKEVEEEKTIEVVVQNQKPMTTEDSTETRIRKSFFDKYVDKIKDFLDNAE